MLRIFYTGDLITPNGSDYGIYGDPCEEGHGVELEFGWVDPDRSLGEVRVSRDDVNPDTWNEDDGDRVEWIVSRLYDRLNGIEIGELGSYYATDPTGPHDMHYTGVSMMLAAHVYGASKAELDAVATEIERLWP